MDSTFGHGKYTLSAVVGGSLVKVSHKWELGTVEITWPPKTEKQGGVESLKAQPEIKHLFQPPPQLPNFLLSLIFTVLCLTPLGIVILGVTPSFPKCADAEILCIRLTC